MKKGHKENRRRFYLLNERINAQTVRVIDDQGKQIGIFSRQDALNLAKEKGLDLVLIAEQVQPPVVKLIDFNKFLYQENKKQRKAKKGSKKSATKDIKLSLFIGENDFARLVKKGQQFLNENHQLRLILSLKGREINKKERAFELVNRYCRLLGEVNLTTPPKFQGRTLYCVVSKKKV